METRDVWIIEFKAADGWRIARLNAVGAESANEVAKQMQVDCGWETRVRPAKLVFEESGEGT